MVSDTIELPLNFERSMKKILPWTTPSYSVASPPRYLRVIELRRGIDCIKYLCGSALYKADTRIDLLLYVMFSDTLPRGRRLDLGSYALLSHKKGILGSENEECYGRIKSR